ncbi:ABC transporter ATP-binding protein [Effusibacillus lacus]|uniref:ABC transporter ATP-binding protein n=1 Tax=Effusibacillus lacus TaxID=1348429 RepID=A0A292YPP5_9BACL|nr:ABC transporter ATP-binding protein [Effusibacillus lacus]TCS72562.1 amino acid/amide ABC transporter ATP-binding protein 2 (HAAT family) [Effusibacillus lacus]GAX90879.1 ABC transporter ATP-binding protein [Effusibacillus lacus]
MLKVENLQVNYGNVNALKGVSLHIEQGEVVTLIGSNGAGKSTLLKTISGLIRPKSGSITFQGEDITRLSPDVIVARGIAHVPEGRRIFTNMTVMENLKIGAYQRRDKDQLKADYEEVFSLFPILRDRAEQMAGTLSGGEQQMLALSRALLSKPKLLLLDEPSLGLAPVMVDTVFDVIDQVRKSGITILLVEQNAHLALESSKRAYVLETGEIKLSGDSQALMEDSRIVEAYLG